MQRNYLLSVLPFFLNRWQLPAGSRIGVDARLIPPALKTSLDAGLSAESQLVCQLENLVDQVWTGKPTRSTDPVNIHPLKFTGRPFSFRNLPQLIPS